MGQELFLGVISTTCAPAFLSWRISICCFTAKEPESGRCPSFCSSVLPPAWCGISSRRSSIPVPQLIYLTLRAMWRGDLSIGRLSGPVRSAGRIDFHFFLFFLIFYLTFWLTCYIMFKSHSQQSDSANVRKEGKFNVI